MLGIGDTNTSTAPSDIISTNQLENNSEVYFNYCIYIFFRFGLFFCIVFISYWWKNFISLHATILDDTVTQPLFLVQM